MARFTIDWIEQKNSDWKVASITGEDKVSLKDVSINRTSKKGEIFPSFDTLASGGSTEGELWTSSTGKHYLFPPLATKQASGGNFKAKLVEQAQDRKRADITEFQGNKEEAIKLASAQRDAVLIVVNLYKSKWEEDAVLESELDVIIKKKIIEFRNWFLSSDFTDTTIPF